MIGLAWSVVVGGILVQALLLGMWLNFEMRAWGVWILGLSLVEVVGAWLMAPVWRRKGAL